MPMFVNPQAKEPITLDGNTIYIKTKMDAQTTAAVQDSFAGIRGRGAEAEDGMMAGVRGMGSYRLALLEHNIVGWEGPDFMDERGKPIPCTRGNIRRLDMTEPLIELVAEAIGERNAPKESPDPN